MPSAQLKSFAEKSGKSMADLERYWDEAKKEAAEKFSKKSKSFWPYVVGIVERRAGLRKVHESISFRDFAKLEGLDFLPFPINCKDGGTDGWFIVTTKTNMVEAGPFVNKAEGSKYMLKLIETHGWSEDDMKVRFGCRGRDDKFSMPT